MAALKKEPAVKPINVKNGTNETNTANETKNTLPLVPPWLLIPLWFIILTLPNLVYSGRSWYDTLHIVKWAVAGFPLGIAAIAAGLRLIVFGRGRTRINFKIDLFGTLWLALLTYTAAQAAWVDISSRTGFLHELLCFAAVWFFYAVSWNSFPDRAIRPLLWAANLSAAVNVVFAELQMRNLNGFTSLILPTPGNYIGNTGQQNMFGLWMAVCVMSSIYLYIAYATTHSGKKRHPAVTALNLALMFVNIWGLLNSTSRSAMLSLFVGLAVMVTITARQFGKEYVRRLLHVGALFALVFALSLATNRDRADEMIAKTVDMVQNTETIGGRSGIWATSRAMFKTYPLSGVGIGQYKWHYLEAQREAFKQYPEQTWQYTHWAHNEFLQWFCEGGAAGGILLLGMWGVWGAYLLKMLLRKERAAREVIWACALVALVSFNALWTRPFHRIENILWLSLAFAVSNRAMAPQEAHKARGTRKTLAWACGAAFCAVGLGGMYYLADGMVGDRMIREAINTSSVTAQRGLLERAAGHLMVKEEALTRLGYHYMRQGEQKEDLDSLETGYGMILQHFRREPHSEDLGFLIDWSQRFQDIPVLETLVSYLKPNAYRLEEQEHVLASGRTVNAVVLVPLHGPGGSLFNPGEADETDPENEQSDDGA